MPSETASAELVGFVANGAPEVAVAVVAEAVVQNCTQDSGIDELFVVPSRFREVQRKKRRRQKKMFEADSFVRIREKSRNRMMMMLLEVQNFGMEFRLVSW